MEIEIVCKKRKYDRIVDLGLKKPSDGKIVVYHCMIIGYWIEESIHSFYVTKDGKKLPIYKGKYPHGTPWELKFPFVTINSDSTDPKSLEFLSECSKEYITRTMSDMDITLEKF